MSTEAALLSYIIRYNDLVGVQRHGIDQSYFNDEWRTLYRHLHRARRDHGSVPSEDAIRSRFPDLRLPRVRKSDLPHLLADIRQRRKWILALNLLKDAANEANSPDTIDDLIQKLQGGLNELSVSASERSHIVDLFSAAATKMITEEIKNRRNNAVIGLPTGLKTIDQITGGLQRQRLYTLIARSGVGKTWLDLLFVANAVSQGAKVVLYPLEMTLFETATRLYTIFTQMHYGPQRVLRNLDLTSGKISSAKVARFMNALEDRFAGQLYVADVAALADPYTAERVEAEVEVYKPDMFWIDYITLLKSPREDRNQRSDELISNLTKGVKGCATRRNVVAGISAQVNRQGVDGGKQAKSASFIPRLEHIAYGDAIGQDSDGVISIIKPNRFMYYSMVKNRHGPEIGKTRCLFDVNSGIIREYEDESEEDDE